MITVGKDTKLNATAPVFTPKTRSPSPERITEQRTEITQSNQQPRVDLYNTDNIHYNESYVPSSNKSSNGKRSSISNPETGQTIRILPNAVVHRPLSPVRVQAAPVMQQIKSSPPAAAAPQTNWAKAFSTQ